MTLDKLKLTQAIIAGKFSSNGLKVMMTNGQIDPLLATKWEITEPYTNNGSKVQAGLVAMLAMFGCDDALKWLFDNQCLKGVYAIVETLGGQYKLPVIFLAADAIHPILVDGVQVKAEQKDKSATIKVLLDNGVDAWAKATDGETALSAVARSNNVSHVKALLPKMSEAGDALSKFNALKFTVQVQQDGQAPKLVQLPLGALLEQQKSTELLKAFGEVGINLDTLPVMKCNTGTLLHTLATSNMSASDFHKYAKPIIDKEGTADVLSKPIGAGPGYEITPLHVAAMSKTSSHCILALLNLGAKADAATTDGLIAIMFAAIAANLEAAMILAKQTSAETLRDAKGATYDNDPIYGSELFPGQKGNKHTVLEWLNAAKAHSHDDAWNMPIETVTYKIDALGASSSAHVDDMYA